MMTPMEMESRLRNDEQVKRRLNHNRDKDAAEAAIQALCYGTPPPVPGWRTTRTWQIILSVYSRLKK